MDQEEIRGQGRHVSVETRDGESGAHGRELSNDGAQVRGQNSEEMAQVRGHSNDSAQVREHINDYARVREHSNDYARVQEHGNDYARVREQAGCSYSNEGLCGRGRDRDREDEGYGKSRRKRRQQSDDEGMTHGGRGRRRSPRRRNSRRLSKRRQRSCSSSTVSSSSGEPSDFHSKSKRLRRSSGVDTSILDKFLAIVKEVRSSDKSKLTHSNVLPDFDPMIKEQTILTWITKVEECAEIYGWDEKETIHYSLQKLCGVAKAWYQGLPTLLHSWTEWKRKLIESFPSHEDYAELLTDMLSKRVKYGESLEEYYYAKLNLLNRCKITGRKAVDCLLHGVDDRAVRVGAKAAQFPEPEQVLKYFRTVKVGNLRENDSTKRNNRFDRSSNANNAKPTYSKPGSSNPNIRCYNCGQVGHPSFKCDKAQVKCSNCDRLGHQPIYCFRNRLTPNTNNHNQTTPNEKQVSELSVTNRASDKYIIKIHINSIPFDCHVDLGSQCTLMRESDARLLNLTMVKDIDLPILRGIGASLIRPLGTYVGCNGRSSKY